MIADLLQPEHITWLLASAGTIITTETLKTAAQPGINQGVQRLRDLLGKFRQGVAGMLGEANQVLPALDSLNSLPHDQDRQRELTEALADHASRAQLKAFQPYLEPIQAELQALQSGISFNEYGSHQGHNIAGNVEVKGDMFSGNKIVHNYNNDVKKKS